MQGAVFVHLFSLLFCIQVEWLVLMGPGRASLRRMEKPRQWEVNGYGPPPPG